MNEPASIACPACGAPADLLQLDGHYGRQVEIDVCLACGGVWLDGLEALQVGPGGVLDLLHRLDDPQRSARHPVQPVLKCPRCRAHLVPTEDRQRDTRFAYHRCPNRHGRFTTFFQFLRSRNFVRELTPDELRALRERVQSVNCSNCGAPVDVARAAVCDHCRTAVSTVEPGQVRRAIQEAQDAEARRKAGDPTLPLRLLEERTAAERAFREADPASRSALGSSIGPQAHLLDSMVSLISRFLSG